MSEGHILLLSPTWTCVALVFIVMIRYFMFAGGLYWLAWVWKRTAWQVRRINPKFPARHFITTEIQYSIASSVIFGLAGFWQLYGWDQGWNKMYLNVSDYGWGYLVISIVLTLLIHEVYFYFSHRWFHTPFGMKYVHRVHHLSFNPSPFAAFSFHPWEAVAQAVIFPVLAYVYPMHPIALLAVLTISTVTGVLNHCGYELMPKSWMKGGFGRWIVTASHHQIHHEHVTYNYSLYFTFLDHWFKTNRWPK